MREWAFTLIASLMLFTRCHQETIGIENVPDLRTLSASEKDLIATSNEFALDLFKTIHQSKINENVFISPLSVDFALNMAVNGASGETKQVMKQTLGNGHLSDEQANRAVGNLTSLLLGMDKKVSLSIANAIWYKNAFTLQDGFRQPVEQYYEGKIEGMDFDDPSSKDIINGWVEDKTRGKIKNLIKEVNNRTAMLLVNAIHFKADWRYQFEKQQTKEDEFTLQDGNRVPVQMMFSRQVKLNHYANETLQLLRIPYGNGQFSMVVLLPHRGKTTLDVFSVLSGENLSRWIEQSDTITSRLYLPRFTMKFKMELKKPLSEMGMGLAFSDSASFGGFFRDAPHRGLAISKVVHQAIIEVDEKGSQAAAATAVGIGVTSIGMDEPLTIRVDRPFVFFIREKHSGAILFAGKLQAPT